MVNCFVRECSHKVLEQEEQIWNKVNTEQKQNNRNQTMMKEAVKILRQSPQSVIEDMIGVSAIFTMVFVALHLPLTL